jgi:hypothetical protein
VSPASTILICADEPALGYTETVQASQGPTLSGKNTKSPPIGTPVPDERLSRVRAYARARARES